jgi:hypothetical protein
MLSQIIKVNGTLVTYRTAINITEKRGGVYGRGKQIYCVRDCMQNEEWELEHVFEQGANVLAKKMLTKPKAGRRKIKEGANHVEANQSKS